MMSSFSGNLTGIVSVVDSMWIDYFLACTYWNFRTPVLSLFARLAKIPNVDPTQMQRHRRASSASSSQSSLSDREVFLRSRSNSRTSIRHSPTVIASSPPGFSILDGTRTSSTVPVLDLSLQRKESRKSVKGKRDNHWGPSLAININIVSSSVPLLAQWI